jgi:hypothetical protein
VAVAAVLALLEEMAHYRVMPEMAALEPLRLFLVAALPMPAAVVVAAIKIMGLEIAQAVPVVAAMAAGVRQTTLVLLVPLTQAVVVVAQLVAALYGQQQAALAAPA